MKKIVLFSLVALSLLGCSDKKSYEAAVLADVELDQKTQNEKDYKVPASDMAQCIVEGTTRNMKGLFSFDPARLDDYRNYTKMLTIKTASDPKQAMEALRSDFGSSKALTDARSNYIESQMECLALFVERSDEKVGQ